MPKLVRGQQLQDNIFCRHASRIGSGGLGELMTLWVLLFTSTAGEGAYTDLLY